MQEAVFLKFKKVEYIDINGDLKTVIVKRVPVIVVLSQFVEILKSGKADAVLKIVNGEQVMNDEMLDIVVELIPDFPHLLKAYITDFDINDVADLEGLYDIIMAIYSVNIVPNVEAIKKKVGMFKK